MKIVCAILIYHSSFFNDEDITTISSTFFIGENKFEIISKNVIAKSL